MIAETQADQLTFVLTLFLLGLATGTALRLIR